MFAGKPVQQKFQPSTNISTNLNAALLSQLQSFDIIGWQLSRRFSFYRTGFPADCHKKLRSCMYKEDVVSNKMLSGKKLGVICT